MISNILPEEKPCLGLVLIRDRERGCPPITNGGLMRHSVNGNHNKDEHFFSLIMRQRIKHETLNVMPSPSHHHPRKIYIYILSFKYHSLALVASAASVACRVWIWLTALHHPPPTPSRIISLTLDIYFIPHSPLLQRFFALLLKRYPHRIWYPSERQWCCVCRGRKCCRQTNSGRRQWRSMVWEGRRRILLPSSFVRLRMKNYIPGELFLRLITRSTTNPVSPFLRSWHTKNHPPSVQGRRSGDDLFCLNCCASISKEINFNTEF